MIVSALSIAFNPIFWKYEIVRKESTLLTETSTVARQGTLAIIVLAVIAAI